MGFDEGIERAVDWYRDNEGWWAPIRSGEYRAYYERQYGALTLARGPGHEARRRRRARARRPRRRARASSRDLSRGRVARGRVDIEFVQDNHSRSAKGILRGLHFQTSPGQAKLVRASAAVSGTSRSTCAATHRPMASGRPTSSTTKTTARCSSRRVRPRLLRPQRHRRRPLQALERLRPGDRGGIAWDDPDVGIEWPISDPQTSERDRNAPRLSEIADELPF